MRELDVALAEPARVVRRENDLHPVVDVEELRVVVHLFGQKCHSRDETPGLREIAEVIALADRIAILDLDPAMKLVQRRLPRRSDQLFDHATLHSCGPSLS